jgi:LCP family protein required for cell wall assembly
MTEPDLTVVDAPRRRKHRRTWPQRLLLGVNALVITGCFAGAGALVVARNLGNSLNKVELADASSVTTSPTSIITGTTIEGVTEVALPTDVTDPNAPTETLPEADPEAKNFLITGADNDACVDPNSPYAAAFGDRTNMGERSDTIMVMRVDPSTKRAAVLSFPRDLWVKIAGTNKNSRINSAYVKDDPTKLIYTLMLNFGIPVDHFIQIDFCAFKTIVDALGGVAVPFDYPARDTHTGLYVPEPGCFTFDGDHALAYVRSRYYQYYDENGKWKSDPLSDLGRVSRQQDFLRRVLSAALSRGVTDPSVARGLIDAAQKNVVVDSKLTLNKMLEFVGVLRDFDPGGIATYQIEANGKTISGQSVLVPSIKGDNMQAILAIFKGEAELAGAPEQVFETTTTVGTPSTDGSAPDTAAPDTTPDSTVPVVTVPGPEENTKGIVPPKDVSC